MAGLKIGTIADDTPIKLSVVLPATVHRDLVSYAYALSKENGQAVEPTHLVGPMLARFMATDRAFTKWRRKQNAAPGDRHLSGTRAGESIER
jgi:hypothetical protein